MRAESGGGGDRVAAWRACSRGVRAALYPGGCVSKRSSARGATRTACVKLLACADPRVLVFACCSSHLSSTSSRSTPGRRWVFVHTCACAGCGVLRVDTGEMAAGTAGNWGQGEEGAHQSCGADGGAPGAGASGRGNCTVSDSYTGGRDMGASVWMHAAARGPVPVRKALGTAGRLHARCRRWSWCVQQRERQG